MREHKVSWELEVEKSLSIFGKEHGPFNKVPALEWVASPSIFWKTVSTNGGRLKAE